MISCPTCDADIEAYLAGGDEESPPPAAEMLPDEVVDRAAAAALDFDRLEAQGRRALAELLSLPSHRERIDRVEAAEGMPFRNPALVELLLARSRARLRESPVEAERAAELAAGVARRMVAGPGLGELSRDLLAEARAHQADALRSRGELSGAEGLLRHAQDRAARSCDLFLYAEVAAVAGALAKDQGRWGAAREELERAERAYLEVDAGVEYLEAVRRSRAEVAFLSGEPEGREPGVHDGALRAAERAHPTPAGPRRLSERLPGPPVDPAS